MPRPSLAGVAEGFRLPFEGARLLLRERSLWAPALVPLLLSLAAFAAAVSALAAWAGPLHDWLTSGLPAPEPTSWISWLWVGPARFALALLGALLFAAVAALGLVAAFLAASALAAPFHDALAARVERLFAAGAARAEPAGPFAALRDAARALVEELRRLLFFGSLAAPLALLGLLVPPAQLVTAPLLLGLTLFFLPLDYASYCLDRRGLRFAEKRRRLLAQSGRTLGFGAAAFLACVIPGASLLAMPVLVVAGTLFALREPGSERVSAPAPAPAPGAGSATSP
jgi:CysZ protein